MPFSLSVRLELRRPAVALTVVAGSSLKQSVTRAEGRVHSGAWSHTGEIHFEEESPAGPNPHFADPCQLSRTIRPVGTDFRPTLAINARRARASSPQVARRGRGTTHHANPQAELEEPTLPPVSLSLRDPGPVVILHGYRLSHAAHGGSSTRRVAPSPRLPGSAASGSGGVLRRRGGTRRR